MNETQSVVLGLLKYEFSNELIFDSLSDVDWEKVVEEARYHRVVPFVYDAICKLMKQNIELGISVEERNIVYMKNVALSTVIRNAAAINKQKQVLSILKEQNIPFCILKGTSLMVNYPNPNYRALGDLDIYVDPDSFERAGKVLEELGYEKEKATTQYHVGFIQQGYEIELHNSVAGLPTGKTRAKLGFMKDLCERGVAGDEKVGNYLVPSVCDNGIIQILHMLHHTIEKGMTLRLLCDWMMFVNRYLTDEVWENEISGIYREVGLDNMAKVVTQICKKYLGLNNPDITWSDDIGDDYKIFLEHVLGREESVLHDVSTEKRSEIILEEDIWERKSKENYMISAVIRNFGLIIKGKRTVKDCLLFLRVKNASRDRVIDLKLMNKKYAREYTR